MSQIRMSFMKKSETKEFKHVNIDLDVHYRISETWTMTDTHSAIQTPYISPPKLRYCCFVLFCFVSHRIILKVKKEAGESKI